MTLARLLFVRHGQTDYNAEGRMQGHLDSHLTELGLNQARAIGPTLAEQGPNLLISSDLSRAARTADEIGQACGLPVKLDPRLRETDLGEWQGLTVAEVGERWPGALDTWRADSSWAPPGGESRVTVAARAIPLVDELEREYAADPPTTVLLCSHGGVIAALVCALLGFDPVHWTAIGGLENACWASLRRRQRPGSKWRLTGYNLGVDR